MSDVYKKQSIANRIKLIEADIVKAREYLETGAHADWSKFRPWFYKKHRNGKVLPPHIDWVKNVFIPKKERALLKAEKLLDRFDK